jgi:hypothetical protein
MAEFMATEVAEYIERGLSAAANRSKGTIRVLEMPGVFLDLLGRACHAGALGLACIGKTGDPRTALNDWLRVSNTSPAGKFAAAAGLLGITVGLARLVELNHRNGVPAAEIAGGLRMGTLGLSFRNRSAPVEVAETAESSAVPHLRQDDQLLSRLGSVAASV